MQRLWKAPEKFSRKTVFDWDSILVKLISEEFLSFEVDFEAAASLIWVVIIRIWSFELSRLKFRSRYEKPGHY